MRGAAPNGVKEPPILAILDEYGDVEALIVKGERFDGPHAPVELLKDIKLKEIPKGVYVIPAERIEGDTVYTVNPCSFGAGWLHLYRDHALFEIMDRGKYWELEISIGPFMDMLKKSLRAVGRATGLIRGVHHDTDEDYHFITFTVPLDPEMTVEQALDLLNQLFRKVDEEMEKRIVEFYEERLAAWRRSIRAKRARKRGRGRRRATRSPRSRG